MAQNVYKNPNLKYLLSDPNSPYYQGGDGSTTVDPNAPIQNADGTLNNDQIIVIGPTDERVYYYHPDHLGSTAAVTDEDGKLHEQVEYFPFGETWVQNGGNDKVSPYLFTSKELDSETGLYYFGARYYDPRTSVWQSPDPILEKYLPTGGNANNLAGNGGVYNPLNLAMYIYAHQNPLKFTDPDGNEISVKVEGANVRIHLTAQATGSKASAATEKQFKTSVEKEFSGTFGKYKVATTVDIKTGGKVDAKRHQIIMNDDKGPSQAEVGGSKATMRFGDKPGAVMNKEMPHEVGHLLGLGDEYKERKDPETGARITPPNPGREDSLMATTKQDARIQEDHIGSIIIDSGAGKLNKGID